MLFVKLKAAAAALAVLATVGVGGVVLTGSRPAEAQTAAKPAELDALRRENELLKLNLKIVLEKLHAREAESRASADALAKAQVAGADGGKKPQQSWADERTRVRFYDMPAGDTMLSKVRVKDKADAERLVEMGHVLRVARLADAVAEVEAALKAGREATTDARRRQAAEALEKAARRVRELVGDSGAPAAK